MQLSVRLGCNESTRYKSDLETMHLVLIDTLDYKTKQKLNQPLDFKQVRHDGVMFSNAITVVSTWCTDTQSMLELLELFLKGFTSKGHTSITDVVLGHNTMRGT